MGVGSRISAFFRQCLHEFVEQHSREVAEKQIRQERIEQRRRANDDPEFRRLVEIHKLKSEISRQCDAVMSDTNRVIGEVKSQHHRLREQRAEREAARYPQKVRKQALALILERDRLIVAMPRARTEMFQVEDDLIIAQELLEDALKLDDPLAVARYRSVVEECELRLAEWTKQELAQKTARAELIRAECETRLKKLLPPS